MQGTSVITADTFLFCDIVNILFGSFAVWKISVTKRTFGSRIFPCKMREQSKFLVQVCYGKQKQCNFCFCFTQRAFIIDNNIGILVIM